MKKRSLTNFGFKQGDRVRLIADLPDTTTDIHPVHHYEGDTGTINYVRGQAGFMSDRYGDITSVGRYINGRYDYVVNYCVKLEDTGNV